MTPVAQAYVHTAQFPDQRVLDRWGKIAGTLSYEIAKEIFPAGTEIEISLEPGSLKTKAKVAMGALLAAYGAIATYPEFKRGLSEAILDARQFAGTFNDNFLKFTGIAREDVVRKERRTEVPGRLTRALDDLERLERNLVILPRPQIEEELRSIAYRLRVGLSELGPAERTLAVDLIESQHLPQLPRLVAPKFALRPDEYEVAYNLKLDDPGSEGPAPGYRALISTDNPSRGLPHLPWLPGARD